MRTLCIVLLTLVMGVTALPAKAEGVSSEDLNRIREELTNLEVSGNVQDLLIAKLEAGQTWDSLDAGKEPVSVKRSGGVTREIYADGSLIVTTIDEPKPATPKGTPTRAVSGCKGSTQISSVKYSGCKAEQNSVVLKMGFYFDYSVPNKGTSVITNAWGWYNTVFMGSSSNNVLSRPASNKAKYSADITSTIGFSWGGTTIGANSTRNLYIMVIVERHGANFIAA